MRLWYTKGMIACVTCLQQSRTMGKRLSSQRTGSARSMPGKDTLRPIMSLASHLLLMACPCRSAATGPRARGSAQLPSLPSHACILGCSAARPCKGPLYSRHREVLDKTTILSGNFKEINYSCIQACYTQLQPGTPSA